MLSVIGAMLILIVIIFNGEAKIKKEQFDTNGDKNNSANMI